MSDRLLEVEDLVSDYSLRRGLRAGRTRGEGRIVRAVDGVCLSVRAGEVVALVGESGCGKSTLAQAIMRVRPTRSGSVRFQSREITRLSPREMRPLRRQMQMIFQDPYESLDPRFRVARTVAEPLLVHRIGTPAERESMVREALALCGLDPPESFLDRYPHELSGGQRQRVAIAAAIALRPKLLVADEPVSMLDVSIRAGILSLLADLRERGLGILMITHDLSVAATFADRIYVMYLGRIVEQGPASRVVGNPSHPYTRALVSVIPRPDPEAVYSPEILRGEIPDATRIPGGCRFHPRCPMAIEDCATLNPRLQSVAADAGAGALPAESHGGHAAACVLSEAAARSQSQRQSR